MCLFFIVNCPTPEFKNDKMKPNNTVNYTSQIGPHRSYVTPRRFWPMCQNCIIFCHQKYPTMHFMHRTFISIDNNLQRIWLHNSDSLSHSTVFWNVHFYMPNVISEESLGFFMWYQCLYYPYSLPQHMTFSDLQPKHCVFVYTSIGPLRQVKLIYTDGVASWPFPGCGIAVPYCGFFMF